MDVTKIIVAGVYLAFPLTLMVLPVPIICVIIIMFAITVITVNLYTIKKRR